MRQRVDQSVVLGGWRQRVDCCAERDERGERQGGKRDGPIDELDLDHPLKRHAIAAPSSAVSVDRIPAANISPGPIGPMKPTLTAASDPADDRPSGSDRSSGMRVSAWLWV